jgi:hypothetical protein
MRTALAIALSFASARHDFKKAALVSLPPTPFELREEVHHNRRIRLRFKQGVEVVPALQ